MKALFTSPGAGGDVGTDFSTLMGGGADSGHDLGDLLNGAAAGANDGGLLGIATTAANLVMPGGGLVVSAVSSIANLFSGPKTDAQAQSANVNRAAALVGITPAEAAAAIGWHANHSTDHFDDLAANVATWRERMVQLVDEYNASNSPKIVVGSVQAAAQQQAQQQQALITTALQTPGYASTSAGQQLVAALQAVPGTQAVGTQGQTAADVLLAILKGGVDGFTKGATDAAASTDAGQAMKKNYLKDFIADNQIVALFLGVVAVVGLVSIGSVVADFFRRK